MKIAIINFGSSYLEYIKSTLNELNVSYELFSNDVTKEQLLDFDGIIFSGSSDTVYLDGKKIDLQILKMGKPILGICYGMQLIHHLLGGRVQKAKISEHGMYLINTKNNSFLFKGLPETLDVKMAHNDEVTTLADGFVLTASTNNCINAASENKKMKIYTTQFHPEHYDNKERIDFFKNFLEIIKE